MNLRGGAGSKGGLRKAMGAVAKIWLLWTAIFAGGPPEVLAQGEKLALRRDYNLVLASIDTLVRQFGPAQLERLSRTKSSAAILPRDMDLLLIFWADDEAEVFINGFPIGSTRLTPTQIEIPSLYLRQHNVLRAHCWDTDRVESGFMAGLYLRDPAGRLRQVLVSSERFWRAGERPAQEIFYTHPQPDIPGAQVIWGPHLFGEIWLEADFSGSALRRAARGRPVDNAALEIREKPMRVHEITGRLVQLQKRLEALALALEKGHPGMGFEDRFKGYATSRLAFTLGKAAPLGEEQSIEVAARLHKWASSLPSAHKELVFGPPRSLKGVNSATPAKRFESGESTEEDRRANYQPPPERGLGEAAEGSMVRAAGLQRGLLKHRGVAWGLWGGVLGLAFYVGISGRQWWRLFNGKVWKN